MNSAIQDVSYAFRTLRKSPAYAAITILTLALGIGANSAIFSVVNGVLLRPLPYLQPDRLVFITSTFPTLGFDRFWLSLPEWYELRDRNRAFSDVGAYRSTAVNVGTPERPRRVNAAVVTPQVIPVLGVAPISGRVFSDDDSRPGAEKVVILSYGLWERDFGRQPDLVGRTVTVEGSARRVVGIMPQGYDIHDERIDVFLPLTIDPKTFPNSRGSHNFYAIARLKDGVTYAQAETNLAAVVAQWATLNPKQHTPTTTGSFKHVIQMDPFRQDIVGAISRALWVLQGAVGFVLLIACANLANLILARSEGRQREFAIRTALGASRWRQLQQFLVEGVLLAIVGGALGAAAGFAGLRAILALNPDSIPRSLEVALDWRVLAFTLAVSVLTGLLFGMAPLLHLGERSMSITLKEGGTRTTGGSARARVRGALAASEVALAVVLVVGAGLLMRSFQKLMQVDPGFNRSHLVSFGISLPIATYSQPQQRVDFLSRVTSEIRQLPGVTAAAAMEGLPPQRDVVANSVDFESYTAPPEGPAENVDFFQTASVDYLETMGIPVVDGRGFQSTDVTGAPVLLVNEALARTFFKGRSAVGQRINIFYTQETQWFTIVGVVRDVKQGGVGNKVGTELYLLNDQLPRLTAYAPRAMNVVVRTTAPVDTLAPALTRVVQSADPSLPIVKMRSMDQIFEDSAARPRFLAELLAAFAALALALAAIGTYGILSYVVTERTREIGIHMALGATRGSVLAMVLSQGMRLIALGLAAGLAASVVLTRLLRTQLFNVTPTDPATLSSVAAFIAIVGLVACYIPARRATAVDPMVTLRDA